MGMLIYNIPELRRRFLLSGKSVLEVQKEAREELGVSLNRATIDSVTRGISDNGKTFLAMAKLFGMTKEEVLVEGEEKSGGGARDLGLPVEVKD